MVGDYVCYIGTWLPSRGWVSDLSLLQHQGLEEAVNVLTGEAAT